MSAARYSVYALALRPKRKGEREGWVVYVGSTAKTPEEALRVHQKARRGPTRRATRLLFQRTGFRTRPSAKIAEKRVRAMFESYGFTVYGACSHRDWWGCNL